jgi:hypothetical protein
VTGKLTLRRDGTREWLLSDATGADVGGITYLHDADGLHYHPWLIVDGARQSIGEPVAQLNIAARLIEEALAS